MLLDPSARTLDASYFFEHCSQAAPDSRTARLALEPDGTFAFESRNAGVVVARRTGRIAPRAVEQIVGHLAAAGFPSVPDDAQGTGGGVFTVGSGDRRASMDAAKVWRLPGYASIHRQTLRWMQGLAEPSGIAPEGMEVDEQSVP